jgi:hypothetical protein
MRGSHRDESRGVSTGTSMGFEFETDADEVVRCYGKER